MFLSARWYIWEEGSLGAKPQASRTVVWTISGTDIGMNPLFIDLLIDQFIKAC